MCIRDRFKGRASINDPNIKISRLDGSITLSGKDLAFNADADMEYINLGRLGVTKNPLTLAGNFSLDFTGNNIDNFLGTASVHLSLIHILIVEMTLLPASDLFSSRLTT